MLTQASCSSALPPSSRLRSLTPSWTNILWPFPPRLPGAPAWPEQTLGTCAPGSALGKSQPGAVQVNPGESGKEEARPLGLRGLPRGPPPPEAPAPCLGFSFPIPKMGLITAT